MALSFSAPRILYDKDLPEEVAKMSIEEQDAAHDDLYGERSIIRENEEMIQKAIEELERCIESINTPKEAYETAHVICPEYVNSREFRLRFLRCERFDCEEAAQKIINYWNIKVEIFGEDKAFRRLCLDDFDNDDQTALTSGGVSILPERDNAGRGIIFSHRALWDNRRTHRNSMLRLLWYIVEAALEDVNIQRKGIVLILYNGIPSYDHTKNDMKLNRKLIYAIRNGLPLRLVGSHQIISSPVLKLLTENGLFWLGSKLRARYKQHSGAKDEILHSLSTYGMQRRILPRAIGGELEFDYEQWLGDRRIQGK